MVEQLDVNRESGEVQLNMPGPGFKLFKAFYDLSDEDKEKYLNLSDAYGFSCDIEQVGVNNDNLK